MKRILLCPLLLIMAGCTADSICWPSDIRKELECPPSNPYRNPYHPDLCYATKEAAGIK